MTFDARRAPDVLEALGVLDAALGPHAPKWCFLHGDGHREWLSPNVVRG